MKRCLLELCDHIFLASFSFLLGSYFLEFFFPGIISFFFNPAWIFLMTLFFGGVVFFLPLLLGKEFCKEPVGESQKTSFNTKRSWIHWAFIFFFFLFLFFLTWKMFEDIPWLAVFIIFFLMVLGGIIIFGDDQIFDQPKKL